MPHIDIDITGTERVERKIDSLHRLGASQQVVRRTVNDLADRAVSQIKLTIPRGRTNTLYRRLSRTRARRIASATGVEWQAIVGIERRFPNPLFPLYVHEGTGLFRKDNPRWITARSDRGLASVVRTRRRRLHLFTGGVMRFIGRDGRVYYRARVAGQAPNPFIERAYHMTNIHAGSSVLELGRELII